MTAILADTQVLLWAAGAPARLTRAVADALEEPTNEVYVSAVSIAEIVIKQSIGKLSIPVAANEMCKRLGFDVLPLSKRRGAR